MNNLSDVMGGANLYGGTSYSFTVDRFGAANSAIYFNNGYLQVPSGVYFYGDFTVIAWINLKSYQYYSRIIDFGNGSPGDNVILCLDTSNPYLIAQVYSTQTESIILENSLQLNQWYHIAFVLSGTTGFIYVNGRQGATGTLSLPRNVQRTRNYIGKSNWPEANADAVYDDLKIYNETLEATDILNEYILTSNYGKIFLYFIYLKFLNHYYITKPLDYILNITFSV